MVYKPDHPDLDTVLREALKQGRTVEVVDAERHGFNLEIDGEPITESSGRDGIPWESFGFPIQNGRGGVSDESHSLAMDILFSADPPRCPECYKPRSRHTLTGDDGVTRTVVTCGYCGRTEPDGGGDD